MPTYQYESIAGGNAQTIEAPSRAEALRALVGRGITPKSIKELAATKGKSPTSRARGTAQQSSTKTASPASPFRLSSSVMSRPELASFINELATAVSAGLPVVPALKTIASQGRTDAQREMLEKIVHDVERGRSLADAMQDVGKPFDDMVIALVRAGELAGRLEEVLTHAAKLLDRDVKLRRTVMGAMIYPAILGLVIVGAIIVVVLVVVPQVLQAVSEAGTNMQLPLPTVIVMGFADFMKSFWWLVLALIAGAIYAGSRMYRDPIMRFRIDGALLKAPLLGKVLRDVSVARFTRTFGTLVGAGLPVLQSLRITRDTLGNKVLEASVESVCEDVAHGSMIAEPLDRSGHFPSLLIQLVGMGEKTGRLDTLLLQAATAFEEKTEQTVKVFTQLLPPMLILAAAPVVVLIILAVLLPLLNLQSAL